jgi:sugar lactone lactonase YvrE
MMRKYNPITLICCVLLFLVPVNSLSIESSRSAAENYRNARNELVTAYGAGDYESMRSAARRALQFRPGYPNALFNLALAQVLDNDAAASMQTLLDLASVGVDFGVAEIDEFAPLKDLLEWGDYEARVNRLFDPVGVAEIAASLEAPDFVPEGIAVGTSGVLFLGSITKGVVVRLDDDPQILSTPDNGHWSVFGMRFDSGGSLWFASAAVPQFGLETDDAGRSGLFRLSPSDGEILHTALLPTTENAQLLGDLVIADDDTLYATDSMNGILYRYRVQQRRFEIVVEPGVFGSPQGLVLDASGDYLYVADYIGGLYRVATNSGAVEKVRIRTNITDYGIDGLYRHGKQLIAIQNGIRPHRVAALVLSDDGLSITAATTLAANLEEFDEPTLGAVSGDDFYFVANSHWNRFDRENRLLAGLSGPIVLRVPLDLQ